MIAEQLDKAVRAVVPTIQGVSIGRVDNRASWSIQYAPGTSDKQKAAGQSVIEAFVYDDTILPIEKLEDMAVRAVLLSEAAKPGAAKELTDYAEKVAGGQEAVKA